MIDGMLTSFSLVLEDHAFWSGIVVGVCGVLIYLITRGHLVVKPVRGFKYGWKD